MLAANYIYPLIDSKSTPTKPYILVKTNGYIVKRYDTVMTVENKQYHFLKNPFVKCTLEEYYFAIMTDFAKYGLNFTLNENPSYVTFQELNEKCFVYPCETMYKMLLKDVIDRQVKIFLDVDFSKTTKPLRKDERSEWLSKIINYMIEVIGFYKSTIYNNSNKNVHITWEVKTNLSTIKAIHVMLQDFMKEQYPNQNITDIIDDSVGLRLPFCYKQEKYMPEHIQVGIDNRKKRYEEKLREAENEKEKFEIREKEIKECKKDRNLIFYNYKPNYYYGLEKVDIKNRREVARVMAKSSLYADAPELGYPLEAVQIKKMWLNRFILDWNEDEIDEVCEFYNIVDNKKKWLKKNGWIVSSTLEDIDNLEEPVYGNTFKFWGKEIKANVKLFRKILALLKPSRVNSKKGWFYMLRIVKAFSINSGREKTIYKLFDNWCSEAENYDENNNRKIWDSANKVDSCFKKLLKMVSPRDTKELLAILKISEFDYELYKASKLKTSDRFKCYEETVNGRKGTTRNLDLLPGIELHSANMGLGKTEVTAKFCEEVKKEQGLSILMISTKVTLAEDLKKRNIDFACYNNQEVKDENINNFDHLIIQLESLHKLKRNYDVLILDEAHELCCQFISQHHESQHQLRVTFERIFQNG